MESMAFQRLFELTGFVFFEMSDQAWLISHVGSDGHFTRKQKNEYIHNIIETCDGL